MWKDFFYGFNWIVFLMFYVIPVLAFVYLYCKIVVKLQRRRSQTQMGTHSRIIDAATTQLIKTAITVTGETTFEFFTDIQNWQYCIPVPYSVFKSKC